MGRIIVAIVFSLVLVSAMGSVPAQASVPVEHSGWHSHAPIAGGTRQEHGVVALGGKVYVIGGIQPQTTGRVEVYDPTSDSWSEAAPLPVAMNHPNVAAVANKIYVIGGLVNQTIPWVATGDAFVYDPVSNKWTRLASMPAGTARGSAAVGVHGTKIYLAGGLEYLAPDRQDTVATFMAYDVVLGTWETLPSLPESRDHVGGGVVGDTFYVLGGRSHGVGNVKDKVFAYNIPSRTWTQRASMPSARGGVSAAVLANKIYVIGGEGNTDPNSGGVFSNLEAYDTASNTWEVLEPMITPRHGTGAAAIGSTIFVPGGGVRARIAPTNVNESYTPHP